MGRTHRATGVAAGAWLATGLRSWVLPAPAPLAACVGAVAAGVLLTVLCGRAALWADLDHHNSTATHSMGLLTESTHKFVHDLSCWVFDMTATEADKQEGNFRGHRGLSHFGLTAIVVGVLLAAATWTMAARHPLLVLATLLGVLVGIFADWIWTDLLGTIIGAAAGLAFFFIASVSVPSALATVTGSVVFLVLAAALRKEGRWITWGATLISTAAMYALVPAGQVDWTVVGDATAPGLGLGVGLSVTIGMLAHSLGDAATKTGVPLLWPLSIQGHRFYPIHIRQEGKRLHTGQSEWAEMKLRGWCWGVGLIALFGWWPGLLSTVWALTPLG